MPLVSAQNIRASLAQRLNVPLEQAVLETRETILVRNGVFCGRKFSLAGHTVTWFLEEDQVKMTGEDGRTILACSSAAFMAAESVRRAA